MQAKEMQENRDRKRRKKEIREIVMYDSVDVVVMMMEEI